MFKHIKKTKRALESSLMVFKGLFNFQKKYISKTIWPIHFFIHDYKGTRNIPFEESLK